MKEIIQVDETIPDKNCVGFNFDSSAIDVCQEVDREKSKRQKGR